MSNNRHAVTGFRVGLCAFVFTVLSLISPAAGGTIYVDGGAGGANNGSSWDHAFRYLQDGLAAASAGDEILVAAGVYRPDRGAGIVPGDREATFRFSWVSLYGGYAGSSSPRNPNLRDIVTYKTVLSGDLAGNDVPVADTEALREESERSRAENCYNVLIGNGNLDGFTITGGNANLSYHSRAHSGGGMGGGKNIQNCTFIANYAKNDGGAIRSTGGQVLKGCTFLMNAAGYDGGAVQYENETNKPVLIDCLFKDNSARRWGGGIHNEYDASPKVVNCVFTGNSAWKGGAFSHSNGGYYELTNCTFAGNVAEIGNGIAFDEKPSCGKVAQVVNCILRDGGQEIVTGEHCCIEVRHSNVEGGWPGAGNTDVDPLFVDPASDDYRLAKMSACINAGDTSALPAEATTDFGGNPRILDGLVDMGAYECQGPRTIYVAGDANGANDGSSWADAYNHLQDALGASAYGDEIRVAQGTYKPDRGFGLTPGDRAVSFELKDGVELRGGYAGLSGPEPDARDYQSYETILSGDLQGDDVGVLDPCDLFDEPSRAENSYGVVTCSDGDNSSLLEGFTITGGCAVERPFYRGGGMKGTATVTDCRFAGNCACAGGGVSGGPGSVISGCVLTQNAAEESGGGASVEGEATVTNCTFTGNWCAINGGGLTNVAVGSGRATLIGCIFTGNTAVKSGGGMENAEDASATVINCMFSGNSASQGGAIYNWCFSQGDLNLANCTLSGNTAISGGGAIFNEGGEITMANCILWGDSAPKGAEIAAEDNSLRISWSDIGGGLPGIHGIDEECLRPGHDCESFEWGPGNIDCDPCFADAGGGDFHLLSDRGRYWPEHDVWVVDEGASPCLDAGDPESDYSNEPMPNGGCVNMGAYGGTLEASRSERLWLIGDINHDGAVNMLDFGVLADNWLETDEIDPLENY